MLILTFILLIIGVLGGLMSTTTGLASLISYPALLLLGLSPINANVTNTFALVFTGISSAFSSRRELRGRRREILKLLPIVVAGCICGALTLFVFPEKTFAKVVPFCILGATVLFLIPKKNYSQKKQANVVIISSWIGVFFVGMYCGYFGAAGGIVMLAILGVISSAPFIVYNAEKNLLLGAANIVAIIIYSLKIEIKWLYVSPLAIGFLIGGYIGPIIVRLIPEKLMKLIVGTGSLVLTSILFFQAFK